jgi:hypothetical protein
VQGSLNGDRIVDYVLNAGAGQRMVMHMSTSNASADFNVQPSGAPAAIHNGSIAGLHYDGLLPSTGDWVIRVYLIRNAARRNEAADYTLTVHLAGASAGAPAADFADADAGGPDYWPVSGASTLNIRSGPSTADAVIGRARAGQVFSNRGCRGGGAHRWCHVESPDALVSG